MSKSQKKTMNTSTETPIDAQAFADNLARASDIWQRIAQSMLAAQLNRPATLGHSDPLSMAESAMHSDEKHQHRPQTDGSVAISPDERPPQVVGLVDEQTAGQRAGHPFVDGPQPATNASPTPHGHPAPFTISSNSTIW